jgi:hypothetical protein
LDTLGVGHQRSDNFVRPPVALRASLAVVFLPFFQMQLEIAQLLEQAQYAPALCRQQGGSIYSVADFKFISPLLLASSPSMSVIADCNQAWNQAPFLVLYGLAPPAPCEVLPACFCRAPANGFQKSQPVKGSPNELEHLRSYSPHAS